MAIYSKSNTFAANTVISSTNVNQNFDEIATAINTTLAGGGNAIIETKGGTNQTTYTTGDMLYASATNTLSKRAIGNAGQTIQVINGVPTWATVNAGAKNYITYNNFENNATTGWSLGTATLTSNLPTGAPTFGSGASGNLTLSAVSTGKLAGSYSLSLASSAATTAGNFIASDALTIDTEDQAKILGFKFYYSPTVNASNANWSGTSSNSFGVAIYDVTNSAWIIPAGVFNLVQGTGVGICQGTFQTPINMTSFRLVIFNAAATSNSITVLYDDFYVGPQAIAFGPGMSNYGDIPWTPTGSWSTNTTYSGQWRRVGDVMQGRVMISLAGAPTSATLTVNLPSGYTIDTTKLASAVTNENKLGSAAVLRAGTAWFLDGQVAYNSTTSLAIFSSNGSNGQSTNITQASPATFGNTDRINIEFTVPISGWSSNTVMSADTDTRVVAALISGDPASATSGNPIIVPTVGYDSHAGYNATTGRYTVPVTGIYRMYGALASASSATTLTIYKNAATATYCGNLDSNGEATYCGAVNCIAGDVIDLRPGGTVDATSMSMAIERLSGPATIAATESVSARYYASGTSVSGSLATINWTTKDYDTHNGMLSGTYTIPVTGKYGITAAVGMTGTYALNNLITTEIQKNGTVVSRVKNYAAAAVTQLDSQISDTISCVAGDTLRIQLSNGCTSPVIVTSNFENYISLQRVGN